MKLLDVLKSPDCWIQGPAMVDSAGRPCETTEAVKWCLFGAILQLGLENDFKVDKALDLASEKLFPERSGNNYISFNEHRSTCYEDVVAVIKEAGLG